MEKDTNDEYGPRSSHVVVDLRKIFAMHEVKMVRETTLAANQWLEEARQMDWSTRYVYSGGDDGILPEDNADYVDEKLERSERRNSEEEETYFVRKQPRKKLGLSNKLKSHQRYNKFVDRRKRAINITENLIDNNATTQDNLTDNFTHNSSRTYINYKINMRNVSHHFLTGRMHYGNKFDLSNDLVRSRFRTASKRAPKLDLLRGRARPVQFFVDWENNSQERSSSEYDFSSNLRKRSARKRNGNHSIRANRRFEYYPEEPDDGITRSIYEMYYKIRPRNTLRIRSETINPAHRRSKKVRARKYKHDRGTTKPMEQTTRKLKRNRNKRKGKVSSDDVQIKSKTDTRDGEISQMGEDSQESAGDIEEVKADTKPHKVEFTHIAPKSELAQLRAKRRKDRNQKEYEDAMSRGGRSVDDEESEGEDIGDKWENNRRKRTASKDDDGQESSGETQEASETEFVVTLRPTQIRTFVIWFVDKRKAYTL